MRSFLLVIAGILLFACNNTSSEKTTSPTVLADSLLKQVINVHDLAMPKMFKLQRLRKESGIMADSLKKAAPGNKEKIAQLEQINKELTAADAAMQDWMNNFTYDTLKNNPQKRVRYLKAQLESATIMKDAVLNSIANADRVLLK